MKFLFLSLSGPQVKLYLVSLDWRDLQVLDQPWSCSLILPSLSSHMKNKSSCVGDNCSFSPSSMFNLQLLALIFTFVPWNQKEVKVERRKEDEQEGGGVVEEEEGRKDRMCTGMLKRGDLLVVPRTLFTHFGIYLGGGR